MSRVVLPSRSGASRWYYADVTAGEVTAVFIFMVGSIFSPRYASSLKKGGLPREHAAVNFALYEQGVRSAWVLTEYQQVAVEDEGRTLRIGASHLSYDDAGTLTMFVKDKTTPWGTPTEATLTLTAEAPPGPTLRLVEGLSHVWQPVMARAQAHLVVPSHAVDAGGDGYHDTNGGDVPLGTDLSGWEWTRRHGPRSTGITYHSWGQAQAFEVTATAEAVSVLEGPAAAVATRRSGWGLRVPESLGVASPPVLLESSPFYARLEADFDGVHALGEVADFARFHSPQVRWMANFRTRYQKAGGS